MAFLTPTYRPYRIHPALRRCLAVLLLATVSLTPSASRANNPEASAEYYVKAAFLYHFTKFVRWPGFGKDFTLCIAGQDPFHNALTILEGETVQNIPIRIQRQIEAKNWSGCHILYLAPSLKSRWRTLAKKLQKQPILTVSDMPDFAEKGGMIGFVTLNQRV